MEFWIWVCQESCSIEDQVYHTKKVLSCCFCKQFSTIRILCIQIFHLALLCYFWRLLRFLHRWNCPCLLKRSKDPDRGVWSGQNLQTCWNWILRHIADNIISLSFYVPVSIPAFLLTVSFWLHVMSVPTSFYRTLRVLRKLNLSHLKLVLAYNYPKIEGKADRAAISVGNLLAPIFWLDKTSLHQGLEKLISWWRLVLSSWNIGQINYQHLFARSALPSPFCWSWSTPTSGFSSLLLVQLVLAIIVHLLPEIPSYIHYTQGKC